ncbi:MAG: hypothetical protein EOP56_15585 [Sphingobacteriales bacterium]|nr:MAG: hypothetical protein EOP56_15585 [Sphingobacteriales bacterium]
MKETISTYHFNGIITNSYLSSRNHAEPIIIIDGWRDIKTHSYQLYKQADKGDSIAKVKGTMEYILVKKNGSTIIEADRLEY